jgi:hypothetical protein
VVAAYFISANENTVGDVLGDFKKYTCKQTIKSITAHAAESRKEWMLKIFKEAGNQQFAAQKIEYIHNNPVDDGIVRKVRRIYL